MELLWEQWLIMTYRYLIFECCLNFVKHLVAPDLMDGWMYPTVNRQRYFKLFVDIKKLKSGWRLQFNSEYELWLIYDIRESCKVAQTIFIAGVQIKFLLLLLPWFTCLLVFHFSNNRLFIIKLLRPKPFYCVCNLFTHNKHCSKVRHKNGQWSFISLH